jgi:hypothetical protein
MILDRVFALGEIFLLGKFKFLDRSGCFEEIVVYMFVGLGEPEGK